MVASNVLQNPAQLALLCSSLRQCFEFDRASAALLQHAPQEAGAYAARALLPSNQPAASERITDQQTPQTVQHSATSEADLGAQSGITARGGVSARKSRQPQSDLAAVLLPRMPPGLANISTHAKYEAVAGIARTAGRIASLAGKAKQPPSILVCPT